VPIMFAATALDLSRARADITPADTLALGLGFVVSFFAALVVVKAFLRFVSNHSFRAFAWYRIVLGLVVLGYYVLLPR
jgi:undecaprenyl-diphosphatase